MAQNFFYFPQMLYKRSSNLHRAFKVTLKNLQEIEIFTLGAKDTNVKNW